MAGRGAGRGEGRRGGGRKRRGGVGAEVKAARLLWRIKLCRTAYGSSGALNRLGGVMKAEMVASAGEMAVSVSYG